MSSDADVRRQIVVLARRSHARNADFTEDRPTEWDPESVCNPESGLPFTPAGAWEFIAEKAEAGHRIERIRLERPPGRTGFVMKIRLEPNRPKLYVKVELGSGRIRGRSFHPSKYA